LPHFQAAVLNRLLLHLRAGVHVGLIRCIKLEDDKQNEPRPVRQQSLPNIIPVGCHLRLQPSMHNLLAIQAHGHLPEGPIDPFEMPYPEPANSPNLQPPPKLLKIITPLPAQYGLPQRLLRVPHAWTCRGQGKGDWHAAAKC